MNKEMLKQHVAQRIERKAIYLTKNTVGKCTPVVVHETKLPEELKKINLEEL